MITKEEDSRRLLMDLHLSEYQTLTARATNYIIMGGIVWPLMISFVGFLGAMWEHLSPSQSAQYGFFMIGWCSALGVQMALILWTFLACEQYKLVRYIEKDLRTRICQLVGSDGFWLFQKRPARRSRIARWFELMTEAWVMTGIIAVALFRLAMTHGFSLLDWIGLSLNLIIFSVLLFWGIRAAKIRQQWES